MTNTSMDLHPEQQKALWDFFGEMEETVKDLLASHDALDALGIVPVDVLAEHTRIVRNVRKRWEYIADNFNTLGVEE
jgi:hypothetical protein